MCSTREPAKGAEGATWLNHNAGTSKGLASPLPCLLVWLLGAILCAAQTPGDLKLLLGHPVSVTLVSGQAIDLEMDCGNSKAGEFLLQTAAPGVEFRIFSTGGIELQSGRIDTAGWQFIPLAEFPQKQLRLFLRMNSPYPADKASVHVRIDWLRIPTGTLNAEAIAGHLHSVAQALHNSLQAEDVRQAIAKYQDAAAEWRRSGDAYGEAIALGGVAESQFRLSRYSEASQTLDRAISLVSKNDSLLAWLIHLKSRTFLEEWESVPAERFARESLSLGRALNDPVLIANALADLAEALYWTNGDATSSSAEEALVTARSSGLPETAAHCLRTEAWIEGDLGHLPHAMSLMTEAQEMFRRAGNMRLALETSEDLTGIESRAGDIFGALTQYAKLASISKGTGNVIDYAILIQNIGNEYAALNKLAAANAYFQIAKKAFSTIHFRSGESMARGKMCDVELRSQELKDPSQSRLVNALNDCTVSVAIAESIQDPLRIAVAKYQLGKVYRRMAMVDRRLKVSTRAYGENVRALDFFKTASNISHSVGDKHWEAQERISLGEVLEDLGRRQDARGEFEKAQSLSKEGGDSAATLEAQYSIARWHADGGELAAAKATLNPALDEIETARRAVSDSTLQASYFAAERKCYELAVYLEMQEFQRDHSSGADAEALQKSEAGRARGLLDALSADSSASAQTGAATHANVLQARMEVDRAFDQRLRLILMGSGKGELETNASQLTQGLAALERIENEEYGLANLRDTPAQFMTAKEIEAASVNSGDTYLEYALGENASYLWVIDQGRLTSYTLPPRDEIEDMVKKWRSLVISSEGQAHYSSSRNRAQPDRSRDLQQLSVKLSCALIGNAIGPQMKRLVIVPDGDLAMLPFTVMQVNACSSMPGSAFITEYETILTPSLSIYLSHKTPKSNNQYKGEVAVVADPVFDQDDQRFRFAQNSDSSRVLGPPQSIKVEASLPRLLNSKFEAESIQTVLGSDQVHLFLGFDASLNTVLSPEMQNYRIWHLATHGVYDEARPEFSGLVFSLVAPNRKPVYGLLKAQDISHMQLRPELVVLSACNSAAGESLSGEGIMGLSYSFLRAGVKQVISTLWNIDDTISKELMAGFYQEMMHNGTDAAEALRRSQLAVLHRHHNSAPYFWAGFELTSVGN